jgi:hypothetical protein
MSERTELFVTPEGDVWCCETCYRLSAAPIREADAVRQWGADA